MRSWRILGIRLRRGATRFSGPGGRALLGASVSLALSGCAHVSFSPRAVSECPGELRSTHDIAGDLRLELRYSLRSSSVDTAFRLAVEKRGDELTLVGLSPLGAVLFSVVQTGVDLEVDALPAAVLAVPPENVLRDLHRALFVGVASAPLDGEVHAVRDGTRLIEVWSDGRLRRRSFERAGGKPPGEIVIEFVASPAEGLAEARIDNGWCGYRATLVTLAQSAPD